MPVLNIQLPQQQFERAKIRARKEGFNSPTEWIKILVSRYITLEESPRISPSRTIKEMRKTGLYKSEFLKELGRSLEYADKAAK